MAPDAQDQIASAAADQAFVPGAWRNLRPTESHLEGISMLGAEHAVDCTSAGQQSDGWIVGTGGAILGHCNGVWSHFIAPTHNDLFGVQAISSTLALAVGREGTFLAYQWKETEQRREWIKYSIEPEYAEFRRAICIVRCDAPGGS